jgi:hypothetical protein
LNKAKQNEGHRRTGAHFVHVPGWMDGSKSRFKDCLQQSKMAYPYSTKLFGPSE